MESSVIQVGVRWGFLFIGSWCFEEVWRLEIPLMEFGGEGARFMFMVGG
jgi:hypothetical protein